MRRISVSIFPKDGYHFVEKDGTIIRGKSWNDVVARTSQYRKRNRLPIGDPVAEVNSQACDRNPVACQESPDPATQKALKVASLKGRVMGWLSSLRGRKQELLFGDEQNMRARADVCAGCPAHAGITGGCGACKKALKELRTDLLGDRPLDSRVAGCTVLGEDVAVSTWIDQPTVDNPELPGCCWRRKSPPA